MNEQIFQYFDAEQSAKTPGTKVHSQNLRKVWERTESETNYDDQSKTTRKWISVDKQKS